MRKTAFGAFFLALMVGIVFSFQEDVYSGSFARLSYVKGDVYIQRAGDLGYEEGTINLPLVQGDKLGTRDGRAEIHLGNRNYLRVDRYTQVDFARLPAREGDPISLHLLSGNLYLRMNSLLQERGVEVHTPDGSFYLLEEGLYRWEVSENQETALFVLEGSVEAAGEEGSELVRAGERVVVAGGYFVSSPEYMYAGEEDSFAGWSRERDAFYSRYVRRTYLPSDLYAYEAELAYYGQWVYERPYGYVWVPRVYHRTWRPYYNGRWVWYPVIGWTWVSYEPWGWCVSHYGRWHWRLGLGWYWIPTRRWGPAWVHWYSGYDYIGWCPLSYYDYPVVIINNRFYGRYHYRDYPAYSRALTVVHKKQLHARRVSQVALSRSTVEKLGKINLSSKQPAVRPRVRTSGAGNAAAAKVLSRTGVRPVTRSYASGKTIRSPSPGAAGISGIRGAKSPVRSSVSRGGISSSRPRQRISGNASPPAGGKVVRTTGALSSTVSGKRSRTVTYPSRIGRAGKDKVRSGAGSLSVTRGKTGSRPSSYRNPANRTGGSTYSGRTRAARSQGGALSPSRRSPSTVRSGSGTSRISIKKFTPQGTISSRSGKTVKRLTSSSRSSRSSTSRFLSGYLVPRFQSRERPSSKAVPSSRRSFSLNRLSPSRIKSSSRSYTSPSRIKMSRSSPSRSGTSRSVSRSSSVKKVKKK